jgi:hypothetical protein
MKSNVDLVGETPIQSLVSCMYVGNIGILGSRYTGPPCLRLPQMRSSYARLDQVSISREAVSMTSSLYLFEQADQIDGAQSAQLKRTSYEPRSKRVSELGKTEADIEQSFGNGDKDRRDTERRCRCTRRIH